MHTYLAVSFLIKYTGYVYTYILFSTMEESTPLLHSNDIVIYDKSEANQNQYHNQSNYQSIVSSNINENCLENKLYQRYWYRWYICLIFAFMSALQGAIWNTWGPIDESAEVAFGFTASEVELLANWGPITFIIFMPFFMWWLDNKGLKYPTITTAGLVALGAGLRCLPFKIAILRYLIHAGQIFNGIAGCVIMAAPPLLSNVWFPSEERILATGIATMFNYLGSGCGFTLGMIVDEPSNYTKNYSCFNNHLNITNNSCTEVVVIRKEINNILYLEFGLAFLVLILMLFFFPNRPPLPPSVSASLPRRNLKVGLLELRHHKQFWVVGIMMSFVIGTWSGWCGVLPIMLKPLNISQNESGLVGLLMTMSGSIAAMLLGWFTDRLKGRMKLMLVILYSIAFILFLYFTIIANRWIGVIPFLPQPAEVWTVCLLLGITLYSSVPLGMEMAADAGYPVCEGTSSSIVSWLLNLFTFVFLFILGLISNPLIANYVFLGFLFIAVPSLIFFTRDQNRRLDIDTAVNWPPGSDSSRSSSANIY